MSASVPQAGAPTLAREPQAGAYAWYVVFILTFCYTVAFIDRQVLNLLIEDVKGDLLLSDVQLSLLQGLAFMGAYIAFSPLFGRWADVGMRRNILIFGVVAWSSFSAMCGLANDYWTLFAARAGVGAAEACLAPAAWSMIADYFRRDQLPRAMSVYLMGPYIGGGLAMITGGMVVGSMASLTQAMPFLSDVAPWQMAFIVIGVPGFLLAAVLLSVREPARTLSGGVGTGEATPDERRFNLREVAAFLWAGRAFYVRFYLGMSLIVIVLYALPAWMPAFLMRHYGIDTQAVGLQYGILVLVMGSVGVLSGPVLDRWLSQRGYVDSPIRAAALASVGSLVFSIAIPFSPNFHVALVIAAGGTFFYSLPQAMSAAALQLATPNRMRGVVASLYLFVLSVVGLGAAPTVVALVTDHVFGDPLQVGTSLAIVSAVSSAGAAWLLFSSLPHYRRALQQTQAS